MIGRNKRKFQGVAVLRLRLLGFASVVLSLLCATANGDTVQFHAWGGSAQVNRYLQWVKQEVKRLHNIDLNHVKLADTSDAVSRVLAEKAAGNLDNGSVDLIWINGENFAAMHRHGLLKSNWVATLTHFSLTNATENPAMVTDFGLPTEGQEAPWGKAAMVFYHNSVLLPHPPKTLPALLQFSKANPGRFTYPLPSDYLGISFLKYALIALNNQHRDRLYEPVTPEAFKQLSEPLWTFLDALHPTMWQQGKYRVRQASELQRLMDSESLWLAFSFTAAEIPSAVNRYDLPPSVRTYAMNDGSLANVHFIGIPFNAAHFDEAKIVVDFLLSPRAQAKKMQLQTWGDDTVLDMAMLNEAQRALFKQHNKHPSALSSDASVPLFAEPHASWTEALKEAWFARYQGYF
ncbi:ABC transporter substrate-binding protein [Alteromonas australica]|uniref:ABC transporter substrate-binding protein n=1 Tax=Alteromonas australica TaxID=589873 RepID=UPI002355B8A0|nr:ABC transporter substrate-binding protein [Alteromonas australica]|tara:strand:+ start:8 stop:1219 length:1212 start_codon:yes stop_codon:yes gene_type:complete